MPYDMQKIDRLTQTFNRVGTSLFIRTWDGAVLVQEFEFTNVLPGAPVPAEVHLLANSILANLLKSADRVQTNRTAARALNTTYTNTTAHPLQVVATIRAVVTTAGGAATAQAKSDAATPPATIASGIVGLQVGLLNEDNSATVSFIVAPGMNYRIDSVATNGTVTLGEWFETSLS